MDDTLHLAIRDLKTGKVVAVSRPLSAEKWPFRTPPPETVVWRYGDYHKFGRLFGERKFYFRRADKLADEFEGRFTQANRAGVSQLFGSAMQDLGLGGLEKIREIQESHRARTFLQCWHQNQEESLRMWQEYTTGPQSIVIRSTVGALARAVGRQCHGLAVEYIEETFAVPEMHSLAPIAYKRSCFAHEKEFRLVHVLPPGEGICIDREEDFFRLIDSEPMHFVQEVRFHPHADSDFKVRVRLDLERRGFVFPVSDSQLT